MIIFLSAFLLALLLPLLTGIAFGIRVGAGPVARLGWTLLGGLAVLFAILLPLNAWMGARWFAWPLAIAITAVAARRLVKEGWTGFGFPSGVATSWWVPRAAAQAIILSLLAWPVLREGLPTQYDGTTCNDNQQFVTDLVTLQRQGYLQPLEWDREHPAPLLSITIMGYGPRSGRVCAQSLGAMVGTLLGQDPVWVYSGYFASLAVFWSVACGLLLRALSPREGLRGWESLVGDLLLILHPMGFYFIINGNMGNGFGMVVATLLWLILRQTQLQGFTPSRLLLLPLGALALAGTYPELIPFTGMAGGLVLLSDLLRRRNIVWTRQWWMPVAVASAGLLLFPPVTIRTAHTVKVAMAESRMAADPANKSLLPPNVFEGLDRSAYLPGFTTLATRLAEKPGWAPMLVLTLVISLCWFVGLYVARDRALAWGWAVAFDVAALMVKQSGYGYGWQKISQYHATILAVVAIIGALYMVPTPHRNPRDRWKLLGWLPLITLSGWFLYSLVSHAGSLLAISAEKCLSVDHLQLAEFSKRPPTKLDGPLPEPWVMEDQTMPTFVASFFQTVWVPRFLEGRAFIWDDAGTKGGYNDKITRKVSEFPWPPPVHVTYRHSMIEKGGIELFSTPKFRVLQNPAIARVAGLNMQERQVSPEKVVAPWGEDPPGTRRFAWMGDGMKVWVEAPRDGKLVIELGDRFEHLPKPPHLDLETPDGPLRVVMPATDPTNDRPLRVEVPLQTGRRIVNLRNPTGAKSPAQAGISVDGRPLSFKVLSIRFE